MKFDLHRYSANSTWRKGIRIKWWTPNTTPNKALTFHQRSSSWCYRQVTPHWSTARHRLQKVWVGGWVSNTRTCSHKNHASRTSGTETVIGNSLKEVLADVLTKKSRKNQVGCFPSTQKGEKTEKSWLTAPPVGRLDLELKCN